MNIYDIAKAADVSTATVSRVLNGGKVSADTKQHVLKVMENLSYSPNIYARALNRKSMKNIGVIVTDIYDIYFSKGISSLEGQLKQNGYDMILQCTGEDVCNTEKYMQVLDSSKVDGFILFGSKFKYIEENFPYISDEKPVVIINSEMKRNGIYNVFADDSAAVYDAALYLFGTGCRNFVYLYDAETPSGIKKLNGFKKSMKECSIAPEQYHIIKCEKNTLKAKEKILELAEQNIPFDAVIASEDELASGAVKAGLELGKRIPAELSVVGYNNSILSEVTTPELTSVDNKVENLCELAVKQLMDAISGKKPPSKIKISCELIKRKTTK